MKKTTIIATILIPLLSGMLYHFAEAQSPCNGNRFLMSKGRGGGCGCHCQKKCVAPADTLTYLNDGYHFGNCWGNCCWIRSGQGLPPAETSLRDIYPNPVSGSATIFFSLSQTQEVSFKLFDMAGRLVTILGEEIFDEGENDFVWNTSEISSGFYFLKMVTKDSFGENESYSETKKVSVIK